MLAHKLSTSKNTYMLKIIKCPIIIFIHTMTFTAWSLHSPDPDPIINIIIVYFCCETIIMMEWDKNSNFCIWTCSSCVHILVTLSLGHLNRYNYSASLFCSNILHFYSFKSWFRQFLWSLISQGTEKYTQEIHIYQLVPYSHLSVSVKCAVAVDVLCCSAYPDEIYCLVGIIFNLLNN